MIIVILKILALIFVIGFLINMFLIFGVDQFSEFTERKFGFRVGFKSTFVFSIVLSALFWFGLFQTEISDAEYVSLNAKIVETQNPSVKLAIAKYTNDKVITEFEKIVILQLINSDISEITAEQNRKKVLQIKESM